MATRKPRIKVQPVLDYDEELYTIMKGVYNKWTGNELALVIAQIRRELDEQLLKSQLEQQQAQLTQQLKELE